VSKARSGRPLASHDHPQRGGSVTTTHPVTHSTRGMRHNAAPSPFQNQGSRKKMRHSKRVDAPQHRAKTALYQVALHERRTIVPLWLNTPARRTGSTCHQLRRPKKPSGPSVQQSPWGGPPNQIYHVPQSSVEARCRSEIPSSAPARKIKSRFIDFVEPRGQPKCQTRKRDWSGCQSLLWRSSTPM